MVTVGVRFPAWPVRACHTQRGGAAEANHSGEECVQGVTGPNDDKCSAEGLTLQLPSGPSVSSAVILQSLSVLQTI